MRRVLAVILGLAAAPASAEWHLDLEVGTDFPVSLGATLGMEAPYGIRASTSVGFMPGGYVQSVNALVVSAGGYTEATADVIEQTLQSSLIWRTHVGWIASFGLYVDAGYGLVTLGGGTSGEALIAAATGAASTSDDGTRQYDVASTLHLIDVELGWKGVFWDALTVRAAIGFSGTVGSSASVKRQFETKTPVGGRLVDEFERWSESYLETTYETYVFTPVVTVAVGYRFL